MKVLVTKGPHAGKVLDMSTRQALDAQREGWAEWPPVDPAPVSASTVEVPDAVPVAEASVAEAEPQPEPRRRGRG